MKIVLATGIYPPQIGGPATYVKELAKEFSTAGHAVVVVTYGAAEESKHWQVTSVPKSLPILRWFLYAKQLRKVAYDADVLYAFSLVSAGVPVVLSRVKKPKTLLRIGGDFFWERYTARGGMRSLRSWYEQRSLVSSFWFLVSGWLLRQFDYIVFSTEWQKKIYEQHYNKLPQCSVIENARAVSAHHAERKRHTPFRLLFMGRYVGFKNIPNLLLALKKLPTVHLTLVGSGPLERKLRNLVSTLKLNDRVEFREALHGDAKEKVFNEHDLLVLPSITEISPNVALEAASQGLPVLLTEETGLSTEQQQGMIIRTMENPQQIAVAIEEVIGSPHNFAGKGGANRSWKQVYEEHLFVFEAIT